MHMSRYVKPIFLILSGLMLLAGCGGNTSDIDTSLEAAHLAATQVSLEATLAAFAVPPEPTNLPPPTEASEVEAPANEEAADVSADSEETNGAEAEPFYVEDFDTNTSLFWTWDLFKGNENDFNIYVDNSTLVFELNKGDIWSYFTYDEYTYEDVQIDVRVESLVKRNYANSLICRVSGRGWYELVISNNGLYQIVKYDAIDNAWVVLFDGGSEHIKTGKAVNDYTFLCQGSEISVFVNGAFERTVTDTFHREGQVGVGVSSGDTYPIIVGFDWVMLSPVQ